MLALLQETWSRLQPALKARAGDAAYDGWLSRLRPLALERGVFFLEAPNRLVCEHVQRLFETLLEEALSNDLGTRIDVQVVPAPESTFDRLEVGPAQPIVDQSNRTMMLVLGSLLGGRQLPATLFLFHGPAGCGKTFLLRWWAANAASTAKAANAASTVKAADPAHGDEATKPPSLPGDARDGAGSRLRLGDQVTPDALVDTASAARPAPDAAERRRKVQRHGRHVPLWFDALALRTAFQAALRDRQPERLQQELLQERPLVVDEVHRLSGQPRMQRELLAAIETREAEGKLTLLASRWHPSDVWDLDPKLRTHLMAGFVAQVDLPGPTARLRYVRALAGSASRNGRAQDVERLAREVRGSYLDLRRAWQLQQQGANRPAADYLQLIEPRTLFERVQKRVTERFGVTLEEVVGPGQARRVSFARQVLAFLCTQEGLSRAEVGRFLGGRSRAAVSYCIKALQRRMADEQQVRLQVESLL